MKTAKTESIWKTWPVSVADVVACSVAVLVVDASCGRCSSSTSRRRRSHSACRSTVVWSTSPVTLVESVSSSTLGVGERRLALCSSTCATLCRSWHSSSRHRSSSSPDWLCATLVIRRVTASSISKLDVDVDGSTLARRYLTAVRRFSLSVLTASNFRRSTPSSWSAKSICRRSSTSRCVGSASTFFGEDLDALPAARFTDDSLRSCRFMLSISSSLSANFFRSVLLASSAKRSCSRRSCSRSSLAARSRLSCVAAAATSAL